MPPGDSQRSHKVSPTKRSSTKSDGVDNDHVMDSPHTSQRTHVNGSKARSTLADEDTADEVSELQTVADRTLSTHAHGAYKAARSQSQCHAWSQVRLQMESAVASTVQTVVRQYELQMELHLAEKHKTKDKVRDKMSIEGKGERDRVRPSPPEIPKPTGRPSPRTPPKSLGNFMINDRPQFPLHSPRAPELPNLHMLPDMAVPDMLFGIPQKATMFGMPNIAAPDMLPELPHQRSARRVRGEIAAELHVPERSVLRF